MTSSSYPDRDPKRGLGLYLTGLGSQYPLHLWGPDKLEAIAARFHDTQNPSIQKLCHINRRTGILARPSVLSLDEGFGTGATPPSITDLDALFRFKGVELATRACEKALREWGGNKGDITHSVAVTCTDQGNPGYDLLVGRKLGLSLDVDRTLLHGVGCAGGLAILRTAAQIALGATAQGKPARILAFACELCTPTARGELAAVEATPVADVGPAGALFSDGAAAFVLCNTLGLAPGVVPLLELVAWDSTLLPDTVEHMSYTPGPHRTVLSRAVPDLAQQATKHLFHKIIDADRTKPHPRLSNQESFDWALHPGGKAIIDGVQKTLGLSDHQLRATNEIYKTRGNSSSPTVLIVLNKLRSMGRGDDGVVACSFGPGVSVEMAVLQRC